MSIGCPAHARSSRALRLARADSRGRRWVARIVAWAYFARPRRPCHAPQIRFQDESRLTPVMIRGMAPKTRRPGGAVVAALAALLCASSMVGCDSAANQSIAAG